MRRATCWISKLTTALKLGRNGLRITLCLIAATAAAAGEPPPFGVQGTQVPQERYLTDTADRGCVMPDFHEMLSLLRIIERAACANPDARKAWAVVKDKAAQLSLAKMAYLPQINLTASDGVNLASSSSPTAPNYDSSTEARHPTWNLDIILTLFDFGLRGATISSARASLASAYGLRDDALRTVFLNTTQAYFDLQKAQAAAKSAREVEDTAQNLSEVVDGRYRGGAALLTEKLQAQSSYADATFKRQTAEGDAQTRKGSLAVLMGLSASTPFSIEAEDLREIRDVPSSDSIDEITSAALMWDPKVASAYADLQEAETDLSAERVRNFPRLTLESTQTYTAESYFGSNSFSIYQNSASSASRDNEIMLKITVPITALLGQPYGVKSAAAKVAQKARDLDSARLKVTMDVWSAYQKMQVSLQVLGTATQMLDLATELYTVSDGRYRAGAGSLMDVLNAKSSLESADEKHLEAVYDLHASKLTLLSAIGRLRLPDLE
jgi:outer membrane protein